MMKKYTDLESVIVQLLYKTHTEKIVKIIQIRALFIKRQNNGNLYKYVTLEIFK